MPLLLFLLSFGTLLHQSLGQSVGIISKMQQKEIIDEINAIRRDVLPTASNMLKMTWSDKAAESAVTSAMTCNLEGSPVNSRIMDGTFCGEVRLLSSYVAPWSEIIDRWHARRFNFQYGRGVIDSTKDVYSYTQLIWYNAREIGCAIAQCGDMDYNFFYICRICPGGNIPQLVATPYKAGPSCEDCPEYCEDRLCTNSCNFKDKTRNCGNFLQLFSCNLQWVRNLCTATCECRNNII